MWSGQSVYLKYIFDIFSLTHKEKEVARGTKSSILLFFSFLVTLYALV